MNKPMLVVKNAGYGETPVPDEALLQPGQEMVINDENDDTAEPATVIAVVPPGVPIEYAIADQNGEPRPLQISKFEADEIVYVLDYRGERQIVLHSIIAAGLMKAEEKGLNRSEQGR